MNNHNTCYKKGTKKLKPDLFYETKTYSEIIYNLPPLEFNKIPKKTRINLISTLNVNREMASKSINRFNMYYDDIPSTCGYKKIPDDDTVGRKIFTIDCDNYIRQN